MANVRVQRIKVYLGSKLIGEILDATYDHNTNDEQYHATSGSNFFSTGNDTTEFSFTTVVPKTGHQAQLKQACLGHLDVTCTAEVDGGIEQADGRFTQRSYKGESKNGSLQGSWKFMGGAPSTI